MAKRYLRGSGGVVDLAEVIGIEGDFIRSKFVLRNGATVKIDMRFNEAADTWEKFRTEMEKNGGGYTLYS